jgi:hypothetical protein
MRQYEVGRCFVLIWFGYFFMAFLCVAQQGGGPKTPQNRKPFWKKKGNQIAPSFFPHSPVFWFLLGFLFLVVFSGVS